MKVFELKTYITPFKQIHLVNNVIKEKKKRSQGRKDVPTAKGALLKATMFDLSACFVKF